MMEAKVRRNESSLFSLSIADNIYTVYMVYIIYI